MNKKSNISYRDAINQALYQEMESDQSVIVYGVDVADHKRVFGTTTSLLERFGNERVFSTPISEDALLGFGIGASLNGLRPVNVHIRADFLMLVMNQLVNMAASYTYGSDGKLKLPLTIRGVIGKGWGQAYQHSKSLQSLFAHIPGLKVAMPSTPETAKGLLISAIRDNNPVVILEHRMLYDIVDKVSVDPVPFPFGKGQVLRSGNDATVIATSYFLIEALKAAEILEKHGISVEVIDPVSVYPLDEELLVKSARKTKNCIIADYDWTYCGFSAEIASRIYDKLHLSLRSPITRLGFAPTHCPGTRPLEDKFYTNAIDIIRTIEKKLKLKKINLENEIFYSYENKFKGPF